MLQKQTFGYSIERGLMIRVPFKFVLGGNTGTNSYCDIYISSLTCKKRHDSICLFIMYYLKQYGNLPHAEISVSFIWITTYLPKG